MFESRKRHHHKFVSLHQSFAAAFGASPWDLNSAAFLAHPCGCRKDEAPKWLQERWIPVFHPQMRKNKEIERLRDSERSGSDLDVGFQEVVHSERTEETGVTTLQHSPEAPNEH
ncbi:hypothetical protein, partial [Martelella sp. AD-3]|uniref:hypothetical protein n=1 Tax=Martelella sp. AD-3 TaxID=686597 RepID=UPI001AEC4C3E